MTGTPECNPCYRDMETDNSNVLRTGCFKETDHPTWKMAQRVHKSSLEYRYRTDIGTYLQLGKWKSSFV